MEPFAASAASSPLSSRPPRSMQDVSAVDNSAIGLAIILGPLALALIVLLMIEMIDRLPPPDPGRRAYRRSADH